MAVGEFVVAAALITIASSPTKAKMAPAKWVSPLIGSRM